MGYQCEKKQCCKRILVGDCSVFHALATMRRNYNKKKT